MQPLTLPPRTHGLLNDLPTERGDGLEGYLQVFLSQWNSDLEPDGELSWEIIRGPARSRVIAVLFSTLGKGVSPTSARDVAPQAWSNVLARLGKRSLVPVGTKKSIYTDTFVRAVSEHEILIIKRDEARHWTRSMAREDADATIARAMHLADQDS